MTSNQQHADDYITVMEIPSVITSLFNCKVHVNTVRRWLKIGVRGHKMRSVLLGGRRYTKKSWISEFFASLNEE